MKIENITAEIKYIELKTPFKTALRETAHVEFVRIYVENENGLVGIGEAPATKAITGEDLEIIMSSINSVKTEFIGLTCDESLEKLHTINSIGSSAKAAFDMAFIYLFIKENNITANKYFNNNDLRPLKTDVTISLNEKEIMLEESKKAFENGMSILKVKLGRDIKEGVEIIKSISNNIPEAEIIVDANQAWNLEETLDFIDAIKGIKVELIEQPVSADDIDSLKSITEFSDIPILADESAFTLNDVKMIVESKSADMINIKLMKCGGVTKALEILEYARDKGVACMLGSMLEGPYSINIALHLAQAYRDVIKYIDLDSPLLYKEKSNELDFEFINCEIYYKG